MGFVHASLLLGAAAAVVPIVLHLMMRQKPQRLEFPALRFVRSLQTANTHRLRLRHLLLLALRVAAIGLLAFALARPTITASGVLSEREAPVAAALIYDTSPRMDYRHQNQTRLEAAQEFSRWLLPQLPDESQLAVLESRLDSAVFQIDRGAAQQRIDRLESTSRGQSLDAVLIEALSLLKTSDNPRKEVYLFTDLARSAWSGRESAALEERIKALGAVGLYVIDVGVEAPTNFSLGELTLSGQVLAKNSPLTVRTDLTRLGPDEERSVEVYVSSAIGKPERRGQRTVQVVSGQSQAVDFTLSGLAEGTHQGFVRIVGEDGLAADDIRHFTVEVKPPWPVLVAAPSPAEEYAFFFTEPLAPEHLRKNDQARFRCDVASLDELAKKPLDGYAAVCLLDPTPLSDAVWARLAEFAQSGRGVAVFLGRNAEPTGPFNRPAAQQLLPGKLSAQARSPTGDLYLSPDSFEHPLLARFRRRAGSIPWDALGVYRYWRFAGLAKDVAVVVPFSDRQPALLERSLGDGRVLTMTTPVSDASGRGAWNDLPTAIDNWPYLMLVNEMMFYLVGSTDAQLNYTTGQTAVLHLGSRGAIANYLLTTPLGEQSRRTVNREQDAIVETSTEWPGNYRVQSGGKQEGVDRGFSVNLPLEATSLARLAPEDLKQVFGEAKHQLVKTREDLMRERAVTQVGLELFPFLIVLVAVVMGLEHALSNLFYRKA